MLASMLILLLLSFHTLVGVNARPVRKHSKQTFYYGNTQFLFMAWAHSFGKQCVRLWGELRRNGPVNVPLDVFHRTHLHATSFVF